MDISNPPIEVTITDESNRSFQDGSPASRCSPEQREAIYKRFDTIESYLDHWEAEIDE